MYTKSNESFSYRLNDTSDLKLKPFLRWAGGKSWLIKYLDRILPSEFNNYHEPFLGGGSVFIYLKSKKKIKKFAYLSDENESLINAYSVLKNNLGPLIKILKNYKNEKEFYYSIREQKFTDNIQKAAKFIFLNRTSFNGIYRVNLKGEYNVPYGFKKYKNLFDFENLKKLNESLSDTFLSSGDFEETIDNVKNGDLVFLDPPYTVAHENNGFLKYNQKIFSWSDQKRLKKYIEKIKDRKAFFILTNAHHRSIDDLYHSTSKKFVINRHSVVGGKGAQRKEIKEYLFTNI